MMSLAAHCRQVAGRDQCNGQTHDNPRAARSEHDVSSFALAEMMIGSSS